MFFNFRKITQFCLIILLVSLGFVQIVQAITGITPPNINHDFLGRGSYFEQKITLIRENPVDDLKVKATIDEESEIKNWLSIDKGSEFIMPKGERKVSITIGINVPKNAEYKNYKGNIRLKTELPEGGESGSVAIATGIRIGINVDVIDFIRDFKVMSVRVGKDSVEGYTFLKKYVPGEIIFYIPLKSHLKAYFLNFP